MVPIGLFLLDGPFTEVHRSWCGVLWRLRTSKKKKIKKKIRGLAEHPVWQVVHCLFWENCPMWRAERLGGSCGDESLWGYSGVRDPNPSSELLLRWKTKQSEVLWSSSSYSHRKRGTCQSNVSVGFQFSWRKSSSFGSVTLWMCWEDIFPLSGEASVEREDLQVLLLNRNVGYCGWGVRAQI